MRLSYRPACFLDHCRRRCCCRCRCWNAAHEARAKTSGRSAREEGPMKIHPRTSSVVSRGGGVPKRGPPTSQIRLFCARGGLWKEKGPKGQRPSMFRPEHKCGSRVSFPSQTSIKQTKSSHVHPRDTSVIHGRLFSCRETYSPDAAPPFALSHSESVQSSQVT